MDQTVNTNTSAPTPNPAATSTRESSVSFNLEYVTSKEGLLKIAEFFCGLICWALVASDYWLSNHSAYQFVLFVSITAWLITLFTFIIYVLGMHSTIFSGGPWSLIEFVNNAVWTVMYFIAACVAAAFTFGRGALVASAIFAFLITFIFAVHAFFSFKEWRGN